MFLEGSGVINSSACILGVVVMTERPSYIGGWTLDDQAGRERDGAREREREMTHMLKEKGVRR